jgi:DMSO reductase family type II enzyme heme b subunit
LAASAPDQQAMTTRYAPARALGNLMSGPPGKSVQDLIAAGPGTLEPTTQSASNGRGKRTKDGWTVVIVRPLPSGLTAETASHVAFAVWEGGKREVGSRKMRTGWIELAQRGKP